MNDGSYLNPVISLFERQDRERVGMLTGFSGMIEPGFSFEPIFFIQFMFLVAQSSFFSFVSNCTIRRLF